MSSPALALTPVSISCGTGAGANTGQIRETGHRHHTLCENTDGEQEGLEGRRFTARHEPGAPPFPLLHDRGAPAYPIGGPA
jgi:hypothetical protein